MRADHAEMHEALMTRGHVHTQPKNDYLVFHPCNVVFRHHVCEPIEIDEVVVQFRHEGGIGGDLPFMRCARYLVRYEGYSRVLAYLEAMREIFPQTGGDALRRFVAQNISRLPGAVIL